MLTNPLRLIGSPVTHENWPTNWPDFAVSTKLFDWPAHNRHTVACTHRFSHILRWSPEPAVWFMFESRAVATSTQEYKRTPSIISRSFRMAVGLKRLYKVLVEIALDSGINQSDWREMEKDCENLQHAAWIYVRKEDDRCYFHSPSAAGEIPGEE